MATRLAALAPLASDDLDALRRAEASWHKVRAHREILAEGAPVREASMIVSGWACRVRQLFDGRRQILGLLLPGELIGACQHRTPLATTSIVALTEVTLGAAPDARSHPGLAEAFAISGAREEGYLFRHVARLGRFNAYERIIDWLLEIRDRLALSGLVDTGRFPLPLTQEMLADVLGLTSVHVNRTLQTLRREGLLELGSGSARLRDEERLVSLVDYRPLRVAG